MADFQPTVRDLALYFCDDTNKVSACWVSEAVYTRDPCALDAIWQNADLYEPPTGAYVINLSRLLGPGKGPIPGPAAAAVKAKRVLDAAADEVLQVGPKDLVVIPSDAPGNAYVVPRAVYTDPVQCPLIGVHANSADLDFMALNEGVVLANLPKATSPSGWTCFLLSLVSLKSGAVPGLNVEDKAHCFAKLVRR